MLVSTSIVKGGHVCDPESCGITYDAGCPCWRERPGPTPQEVRERKRRGRLRRQLEDVLSDLLAGREGGTS